MPISKEWMAAIRSFEGEAGSVLGLITVLGVWKGRIGVTGTGGKDVPFSLTLRGVRSGYYGLSIADAVRGSGLKGMVVEYVR